MAADPIRFMLIEDGADVRPFVFSTNEIQIGCDASRGDNLLIELPPGKRHVRARVIRSDDYVELEVVGGPIWLQGSRMDEGDVAELNVGDILVFGTKKPGGSKLRFEYSREAEIVMDDVADWSVAANPKKKRGQTAEDDMLFEEEADPTEGMNVWQKIVFRYRERYRKLVVWRKKAARIKYWISLAQVIWMKAGQIMLMVGGFATLGFGWYHEAQERLKAVETAELAQDREVLTAQSEKAAIQMSTELQEEMRQCGCDSSTGADVGAVAASEAILGAFDDETQVPERAYPMPDGKTRSLANIISPALSGSKSAKPMIDTTLDRVCSARKEKKKMVKVQAELRRYGIHEAYSFIPFVESLWCELAVSFTGPRGMMQFTRSTAQEAFRQVDATQSDIPNYDWEEHDKWLRNESSKYGGYYRMLAKCPAPLVVRYQQTFYNGETNPQYPNRLDPNDPRTDWEASTVAAFGWLQKLDRFYADKGFRETDRIMLAMTAYNQGQGEVQIWIDNARAIYKVDSEGALTFPQVYAGAIKRLSEVTEPEKKRQVKEGMNYAPKIMGRYLYTKPRIDDGCRD